MTAPKQPLKKAAKAVKKKAVPRKPGAAKLLSGMQTLFVTEYLVDLNGTQAAIRAGYSKRTANEQAARLLANVSVQEAISKGMQKRTERVEITADMVLQRWWKIATANPNDLTQHKRGCCRYCYGQNGLYQWTHGEYQEALRKAIPDEQKSVPDCAGGLGFDRTLPANPNCQECHGEGEGRTYIADTRNLSPDSLLLFAGVKQTKEGLQVLMHDQAAALANVARHLGMFTDNLNLKSKVDLNITDITDEQAKRIAAEFLKSNEAE